MPPVAHFIWSLEGKLPQEVIFGLKSLDRVLKRLINQAALPERVTLVVRADAIALHSGGARISMR